MNKKHYMKNKYLNKKSKGFDSQIEVKRMNELLLLEKSGAIKDITQRPLFKLQEGFKYKNDKRKEVSIKYTADFKYFSIEKQKWIIEETKGAYLKKKQADYSIRRRLLKYSIKDRDDIEFVEIIYDK
jgi:hypothetical protein